MFIIQFSVTFCIYLSSLWLQGCCAAEHLTNTLYLYLARRPDRPIPFQVKLQPIMFSDMKANLGQRYVGVDSTGKPLVLAIEVLQEGHYNISCMYSYGVQSTSLCQMVVDLTTKFIYLLTDLVLILLCVKPPSSPKKAW